MILIFINTGVQPKSGILAPKQPDRMWLCAGISLVW